MAPSFLPFFYQSKIEHTTAFLLRSTAHTMLGTVYSCTCARYSSLCTLMISCLYWTVQLPGATLASAEVWRVNLSWPMRDQHMNHINQSSYCHIQTDHPSIHPTIATHRSSVHMYMPELIIIIEFPVGPLSCHPWWLFVMHCKMWPLPTSSLSLANLYHLKIFPKLAKAKYSCFLFFMISHPQSTSVVTLAIWGNSYGGSGQSWALSPSKV